MRLTPFTHEPVDTETAEELLSRYKLRNIKATKTLAFDPRLWIVTALLPEYREDQYQLGSIKTQCGAGYETHTKAAGSAAHEVWR
jgi:hypothetical protein